jgi:hypothetical protein
MTANHGGGLRLFSCSLQAFLASCPLVHTLSLPSVSVTDKETLNTLLSHKPLRYLKVGLS